MNHYVTAGVIKSLREKNNMTQKELADKLFVSDKTISKWETAKGYPDITLLEPIAKVFGISVSELIAGDAIINNNVSANMLRSNFYICPICGNVVHSMGALSISCHGVNLLEEEASRITDFKNINVELVEDEYFIDIDHDMTKNHYISFIAGISFDGLQLVKLYPEGQSSARLKRRGLKRIYFYDNKEGLYYIDIKDIKAYL